VYTGTMQIYTAHEKMELFERGGRLSSEKGKI
jgi:hypothetical protein